MYEGGGNPKRHNSIIVLLLDSWGSIYLRDLWCLIILLQKLIWGQQRLVWYLLFVLVLEHVEIVILILCHWIEICSIRIVRYLIFLCICLRNYVGVKFRLFSPRLLPRRADCSGHIILSLNWCMLANLVVRWNVSPMLEVAIFYTRNWRLLICAKLPIFFRFIKLLVSRTSSIRIRERYALDMDLFVMRWLIIS